MFKDETDLQRQISDGVERSQSLRRQAYQVEEGYTNAVREHETRCLALRSSQNEVMIDAAKRNVMTAQRQLDAAKAEYDRVLPIYKRSCAQEDN